MKKLWNYINNSHLKHESKTSAFIALMTLIFTAAGFILWFIVHFFALNTPTWAIIFTGYPGILLGAFGSALYLIWHNFK